MRNKNTKYVQISELDGMMPPYDIDFERAVLGSIMLEAPIMLEVEKFLEPEVFYHTPHVEIYRAIYKLFIEKQPYDILTVSNQLRKDKLLEFVGGAHYVATLTNRVGSTSNAQFHSAILRQKWIQRRLIETGWDMVKIGYDDAKDCFDALDEADLSIKAINISLQSAQTNLRTFKDLMKLEAQAYQDMHSGKNLGIKVNIENLDRVTNGWQKGDLIVIAARPSMGKSVLALNNAKEAAKNGSRVAMFSLEMPAVQLMQRLAADEANIDFDLIKKAKTSDQERQSVNVALGRIENLPLFIDDTAQTTVLSIWSKAAKIKGSHGLDLIVIDYIQLISAPEVGAYADANARVAHITRNLKLMAKELDVPVIALSQLSRDVEKRGGQKKPMLSDLRDSGSIEQDADVVCFPWRPGYYEIERDADGNIYTEDYTELIFAKHRNGILGAIKLSFDGNKQRFTSYLDGYKALSPNVDFSAPTLKREPNF